MPQPKQRWRLTVRDEFAAAHALRFYEGKCENIHGHNFSVEAVVEGEKLLPGTEIVLDFKVLKKTLGAVLDTIDHKLLNEVPPFDDQNPSSENLACYIYRKMQQKIDQYNVHMHSVTVSEKATQSATYQELP